MQMRAALKALSVLGLATLPAALQAQAFVQDQGEGRVIITGLYSNSDKAFDDNGNVYDINNYRQAQVYFNFEYGATDDLTLLLTPSLRDINIKNEPQRNETGFQFVDLGARYRIAEIGSTHISLQGKVRIPIDPFRDTLGQVSSEGMEFDLRAQVGHGFGISGHDAFVIGDAGYTFRGDDPPNEFHADIIFGFRPTPRTLLMANLYNTFSDGPGDDEFRSYRYHNLFLSGVYDINDTVSLHLGGLMTLDGKNALRERGLLLGAWIHF
ncbi:hypothetical protein [Allosphingosinicella vermicomposti]|uniref:hypothetical protein n=1 Tax=Allosphingosinicella vermicomposti TaxID=614671 RepID=UPI00131A5FF9|nr:hypothetical protein [Allosphingosinicella vermicomposti]